MVIDWQHATSPFQGGNPAPPESGNALGLIVGLELKDDGLYAIPAYNERGLEVVQNAGGVLWSSPEFITGDVFSRDGGELIGNAQLLAITLTPRPAQSNNKIDRITLNERFEMSIDDMSIDELRRAYEAKDELVKKLEKQIQSMKEDNESSIMNQQKDNEEKSKMTEKDEDEEKSKLAEKDEEKSYNKMSESLNEAMLLSEVQALRESHTKLSEQLETIKAEKLEIEKNDAVKTLLNEGRITPAEQSYAAEAWELKDTSPNWWKSFSERPMNSTIPLDTKGHGASGQEISKQTLSVKIKELVNERNVSYSEALNIFRNENPDYYAKAYGV